MAHRASAVNLETILDLKNFTTLYIRIRARDVKAETY